MDLASRIHILPVTCKRAYHLLAVPLVRHLSPNRQPLFASHPCIGTFPAFISRVNAHSRTQILPSLSTRGEVARANGKEMPLSNLLCHFAHGLSFGSLLTGRCASPPRRESLVQAPDG
jgi:hypothetical protein